MPEALAWPPLRHLSPEWGSTYVEGDLVKEKGNPKQTVAIKENQLTLPQATIQTLKSDVRTIDKHNNLEMTHLPAANKHYHSWLIPITINQISTFGYRCHLYHDSTVVIWDSTNFPVLKSQARWSLMFGTYQRRRSPYFRHRDSPNRKSRGLLWARSCHQC